MKNYIFRSLPRNRDSRTIRYMDIIDGDDFHINTWEDEYKIEKNGIEKLKIARNKCNKAISYPFYLLYLFLFSFLEIKKGDRVICMDIDTFLPVYLGSFFKKSIIYLDVVDPISQTKFKSFPFPRLLDSLEYFLLSKRKFNILPNDNRVSYYCDRLGVKGDAIKYILIENVPTSLNNSDYNNKNNKYDIGYFGSLEDARGILELLYFAEREKLKVLIAGMGKLEGKIAEFEKKNNSLSFYGAYTSDELPDLYSQVEFCWAYYTDKEPLHKYASPNKFYEHLAFKTPMITNEIVPMSKFVENHNTGFVMPNELTNDNFDNLNRQMESFDFSKADYSIWSLHYENYSVDFTTYENTSD